MARPIELDELHDLASLAQARLLPRLHALARDGPTWVSPSFMGSAAMRADADLTPITLVEVKTELRRKTRAGRKLPLERTLICQLLGYVLHDLDDRYDLRKVALYQARYGHLAVWPLDRLLRDLAGTPKPV